MEFNLRKAAQEKILIAAHRGASGGNIPCNTIPAYELALRQGADMIEIDVALSKDGVPFIFHPGMERAHLGFNGSLSNMYASDIRNLRYVNYDLTPTQFPIHTLDEVLERFKGRRYINVDKFGDHPEIIARRLRAYDMTDQILIKTGASDYHFDHIERFAPEIPYMVVTWDEAGSVHEQLLKRNINYIGQELLFSDENSYICSREYINRLKSDNILAWVNAIVYNYLTVLSAGHSDDMAILGNMENSWGWLAKRGFDIIQTDWTGMLNEYLTANGLKYR
ncbi:MAG: glycerophosphodiester phosphodiesterase family protein [Clostridia bacterium]|nr:glycerophosphodiester phosphodiesterase family protein [Clostridia bacterium]